MPTDPIPPGDRASDPILAHAERIRASGVLGKSGHIRRLFDFLVECAQQGRVPKEIEVAIDGFGKDAGFDASQDALVRVYVHKLRRKLDEFYASSGHGDAQRLVIPRGEYRLIVAQQAPIARARAGFPRPQWLGLAWLWTAVAFALCIVLGGLLLRDRGAPGVPADVMAARRSGVWGPLFADDLPIQIVLGDYYIFGERDPGADQPSRLVRDFDINSREDLERRLKSQPALQHRFEDLSLGYLPTSSAYALRDVLAVLLSAGKRVRITLASQFSPAAFKTAHVVYIGYLSGLGPLQDAVFSGSRFAVGSTFDELIDTVTGKSYLSEAGAPLGDSERYRDYAYFATFNGPNGNRHVILAGTRDTGLQQVAEMLADPRRLAELVAKVGQANAFEALYEVYGVDRTNIDAQLLVAARVNTGPMWSEPAGSDAAPAATPPDGSASKPPAGSRTGAP